MTALVDREHLASRMHVARGPLAGLTESLAKELATALPSLDIWIPQEKARLTRTGGRCRVDGTLFAFDPAEPHVHRCPACGSVSSERDDYEWWVMNYQLWLAERAVHAAALALVTGDRQHGLLADAILGAYADQYLRYPNRDNVLGPTRPFFSTYLESIWMLQLAVALDLREAVRVDPSLGGRVRDDLLAPSAAMIAEYDEGASNRQVWNCAALAAAGLLLDDQRLVERAIVGPHGIQWHLDTGMLADGTWYEGENYHLFAHRGLWYGVLLAASAKYELTDGGLARFEQGFAAPFLTALPDLTFPSRRDSQYRVSLRQWRIGESCELGLARRPNDRVLRAALHGLYHPPDSMAFGETGRTVSTAEAERNVAGTRLSRASLGWKTLLFGLAELPELEGEEPQSVLLPEQGFAVIRRDHGRQYVALDYGHSGNGHGHPDRLNLWLVRGQHRVLEDVGTGSYTSPTLHWYRSTLAHNAPLVDGRSQRSVHGQLVAYDDQGVAAWVEATAAIADGVMVRRAVHVVGTLVYDEVTWTADRPVRFELPIHVDADVDGVDAWQSEPLHGGDAPEDGFGAVTASWRGAGVAPAIRLVSGDGVVAWIEMQQADCWRAIAPGPPGTPPRRFYVVRAHGAQGRFRTVWSGDASTRVEFGPSAVTISSAEHSATIRRETSVWRVEWRGDRRRGKVDWRIPLHVAERERPPSPRSLRPPIRLSSANGIEPTAFDLGRDHYRRSEEPWDAAGSPTARVTCSADREHLTVHVAVIKDALWFAPPVHANPLDNENPDTNSDGLQLYVGDTKYSHSWIAVPEPDAATMRLTPKDVASAAIALDTMWQRTPDGWSARLRIPRSALSERGTVPFALQLVVNEMPPPPARERRRGQLVLEGGGGEWVYLRGDREQLDDALTFVIDDA